MLEADHKKYAHKIFKPYVKRLFKKHFNSIEMFGDVPKIDSNYPLLLLPNHSTWWDGFFVYLINENFFKRKFYIMIVEEQLSQYKFFQKLGGFSIKQDSFRETIRSLKYTAELTEKNPFSVVNIFPQGELLPNDTRPIIFNKGVKKIVEFYGKPVNIIPLGMRIMFLKEQYPTVFFNFGQNHIVQNKMEIPDDIGFKIEMLLEGIKENVILNNDSKLLLKGKSSAGDS